MNLESIQIELEDEMVSAGAARYAVEVERGLNGTGPGKLLLRKALHPMAEAITVAINPPNWSRAKRGAKYIKDIDPYVLADLTMRRVLDCAAKEETLTKTCKAIAAAVEWHTRDAALNAASVAIWNKLQERLKKTQNPSFRRKSIDGTVKGMRKWAEENAKDELVAKLDSVKGVEWDIDVQIDVGSLLVSLFSAATKLVTTAEVRKSKNQSKVVVRFTAGTQEWLEKQHEYHSILRPVHLPMVVMPTNWSGMSDGGYIDNAKAGVKFLKTKAKQIPWDSVDLTDAYEAVNRIQATPWRVNLSLFNVMSRIWDTGSEIGDVPPLREEDGMRQLQALPSRLADMTPEQRKADPEFSPWANKRREAHEFNAELKSAVKGFGDLMSVATRFSQYPAFYHPHKLDWRQRAYPISVFMSPQGDQFNRALIEFAEGRRMGDNENSGAWLAIHGANCYGVDKVTFDERIAWVESNEDLILESAMDPYGQQWWTSADGGASAWPFLAFCMEWLAYRIAGDDHVTHLPVALDGSNSGLQHLSAMLGDPDGAKITCVMPGEKPEDVYQLVADQVERELVYLDDPMALIWCDKVTRKICKQPTMTYTYSATEAGMRNQILHALTDLDKKARNEGLPSYLTFTDKLQDNAQAASYLAPVVRKAIAARMKKAAEAMEFLQLTARTYSKTGLPLRWTTPLGVPVVQYYPTATTKRRHVYINGQKHKLHLNVDSPNRLDKKRAAAGVSPNYVHSMDSTHLLWTVLGCYDEHGIQDFSMIHDSFGTHATDCDALAQVTREMFVNLYDQDRLAILRNEVRRLLGDDTELLAELPAVPESGSFDINTVMDSEYFFA